MNKVYTRQSWVNNSSPALNAAHLNHMEAGIDALDDRLVDMAADVIDAGGYAQEAKQAAQEAKTSASTASDYARQALNSATSAESSAHDATYSASRAMEVATEAYNKACQAIERANTAINTARDAYNATFCVSPITGIWGTVVQAIDDLYNFLRQDAVSAGDYDAAAFTAAEYDALGLTAFEYDFNGKKYIHR